MTRRQSNCCKYCTLDFLQRKILRVIATKFTVACYGGILVGRDGREYWRPTEGYKELVGTNKFFGSINILVFLLLLNKKFD